MENHPLLIPELLELVLWELHTSRQDLIRCSLVTRAWTFPTQAYLFRSLHLSNRHPIELSPAAANTRLPSPEWKLLASALNSSPHLILHVRRLRITLDLLQPDEQPETGGISFEDAIESLSNNVDAHNAPVEALVLNIANGAGNVSPRYLAALRGLLSVPRLQAVTFSWGHLQADNLATLWENCAADIRHLEFIYSPGRGSNLRAAPAPEDRDQITLESLSTPRLDEFSSAMGWRFDFSKLKTISTFYTDFTTQQLYATSFTAVRELRLRLPSPASGFMLPTETSGSRESRTVDLAALPNLTFLGLSFTAVAEPIQTAIKILSTLANPSRVLKTIQFTPRPQVWEPAHSPPRPLNPNLAEVRALDDCLAAFLAPVELWVFLPPSTPPNVWRSWLRGLPKTHARSMLCRAHKRCDCCRRPSDIVGQL
ncbi:NmrA domain-containing protein [Mycena indigotica]|uniref:NmrA domain-containing protein n=1 Tax=Mycena indigotica TaxID=2126181 RepID=A0A8H6TDT9_9AGAR|nr:NmrA domain-containing protein [Mycena indigotica]KAF7314906.1 NmrA domain-containing protein [Mycena indigotica]